MSIQHLTAEYQSPSSQQNFSCDLPSPPSDPKTLDVKAKTAYLTALRSNIGKMQSEVNTFLTKRMEAEKRIADGEANGSDAKEKKEEEMYGEEDAEADG